MPALKERKEFWIGSRGFREVSGFCSHYWRKPTWAWLRWVLLVDKIVRCLVTLCGVSVRSGSSSSRLRSQEYEHLATAKRHEVTWFASSYQRPQVLTHVTREQEDAVREHPVGKIYLTRECCVFSSYRSRRTSALIVHYLLRLQSKEMLLYYLIIRLLLGAFILAWSL